MFQCANSMSNLSSDKSSNLTHTYDLFVVKTDWSIVQSETWSMLCAECNMSHSKSFKKSQKALFHSTEGQLCDCFLLEWLEVDIPIFINRLRYCCRFPIYWNHISVYYRKIIQVFNASSVVMPFYLFFQLIKMNSLVNSGARISKTWHKIWFSAVSSD